MSARPPRRPLVVSALLYGRWHVEVEAEAQPDAGAHAELGVDAREGVLDRPLAEEQRRGDLLVRLALGDELGDLRSRAVSAGSPRRRRAGRGRDARAEPPQLARGGVAQAPRAAPAGVRGDPLQRGFASSSQPAAASRRASSASPGRQRAPRPRAPRREPRPPRPARRAPAGPPRARTGRARR